ncbi:MAG: hypothetical protein AAF351_14810 [Pseudomonadota bacterium]
MANKNSIKEQIRRNSVALISLAVAITSLGYNTWRNEQSEENRTQRLVAIEALGKLADLQAVVWHHHWDKDFDGRGNLRTGWTLVLTVQDVSVVLDEPVQQSAANLYEAWKLNSPDLGDQREAEKNIVAAIDQCRDDMLALLQMLD